MANRPSRFCPRCRGHYAAIDNLCPDDGAPLFTEDQSDDPLVGQELDGRYTIVGLLGAGGMGSVYRAVQHSMEREVAIKLLQANAARDPDIVSRFLVEARGVSHLAHPNIVSLFDFGKTSDDQLYLVMEILRGQPLRRSIPSVGMAVDRALRIIGQLCAGLHYAHEAGIVHRDLKPENVMLCETSCPQDELVKIVDFGIARVKTHRAATPATKKGEIYGTPAYMSPEQALGAAIDRRSDLYAVGLLLYEVLTGAHAFPARNAAALLLAHLNDPPPRLVQRDSPKTVAAALDELVATLLAKNPADRPENADEVRRRLEALAHRPGLAHGATVKGTHHGLADTMAISPSTGSTADQPVQNSTRRTNLHPQQPLLGREKTIEDILSLLDPGRIVTIHGPAGMGKTSLSRHVGLQVLDDTPGDMVVWFCDLTEARSIDGICHVLGETLGVPLTQGTEASDTIEQLGEAIAARGRLLLILDNFEQVVTLAPATIERWCRRAPAASFLVTSREVLGVSGETVFELAPLMTPALDADTVADHAAVRLFVERTKELIPDYELTTREAPLVAEIVRRLDGIPLAIELAAARMKLLGAEKLLARLGSRFAVLSRGRRSNTGRQATMRGAIDWSWELLDAIEQSALAQLSVFRGGWSLEATEDVIVPAGDGEDELIIDLLQSLNEKSLVRAVHAPPTSTEPAEPRYRLYESIREYAAERLQQMGLGNETRKRHAAHYLQLGEQQLSRLHTDEEQATLRVLAMELENLVAVHERALAMEPLNATAADQAIRAMLVVNPLLKTQGPFALHMRMLEATVVHAVGAGAAATLDFRVLVARADALRDRGDYAESLRDVERAEQIQPALDDSDALTEMQLIKCRTQVESGDLMDAEQLLRQIVESLDAQCPTRHHVRAYHVLGNLLFYTGRTEACESSYLRAREIAAALGMGSAVATMDMNLGYFALSSGQLQTALELMLNAKAGFKRLNHQMYMGAVLTNVGQALAEIGVYDQALTENQEAIDCCRRVGDVTGQIDAMFALAHSLSEVGDMTAANEQYDRALAMSKHHEHDYSLMLGTFQHGLALLDSGASHELVELAAERVSAIASKIGMTWGSMLGHTLKARLLLLQEQATRAADSARQATDELQDSSTKLWAELAWHTRAEALRAVGDIAAALHCAKEAARIIEGKAESLTVQEHAEAFGRRRLVRSIRALRDVLDGEVSAQ